MSEIQSAQDLVRLMIDANHALDEAQQELNRCVRAEAETSRTYRLARANAYLATSGTVGEREASVDKTVADERYEFHLAEGLAKSALENVRNKRQQVSVLQTISSSWKEEAGFARFGPKEVVG